MKNKKLNNNIYWIFVIYYSLSYILSFFNLISKDLALLNKIMSWFGLGFVLYKISFMKIFFGKEQLYHTTYKSKIKNYIFDILIIISFYLLKAFGNYPFSN